MPRFARLVIGMGLRRVERERARWVQGLIGGQDAGMMIAAWRAAMAFDSRPRLGAIRCPTLVLAGAVDDAVPMHHTRQLHEGIAGSRLVVLDEGDHALIWAMPDAFADAVLAFLAG
jgi:3-oxoadipate enol-lactonase